MKFFKFAGSAFLLSILSASFSFATGTTPTCPGVAHTVQWSSTDTTSCSGVVSGGPGCTFGINTTNSSSPIPVTAPASGSCTANITCVPSASDATTLQVYTGADLGPTPVNPNDGKGAQGCCGVGIYAVGSSDPTNAGKTSWNGSSCVVPPPADCAAGVTYWSNCGYSVGTMTSGQSGNTVANSLSGYTGSADFSCSNGVTTISNPTCTVIPPSLCGSSNNGTFATAPSSNLCSVGTASALTTLPDCATAGLGYPASCTLASGSTYNCSTTAWVQSGYCDVDLCSMDYSTSCSVDSDCGYNAPVYAGSCTTNSASQRWTWSCTGSGAPASCNAGQASFFCTGSAPTNATLCPSDCTGLVADSAITLVNSCTPTKGEYTCNAGYHKSGASCVVDAPATPTGFWTGANPTCGTGQINLSWNVSPTATSYEVYRGGVLQAGLVPVCDAVSCTVSNSGLTAGASYTYSVLAKNAGGSSAQTATQTLNAPVICICTGTAPANSSMCSSACTNLPADTARTLVNSCTSAKGEYICSPGYIRIGDLCVADVVIPAGPPPAGNTAGVLGFYVTPSATTQGSAATLFWTSIHADTCSIVASFGANPSTGGLTSGNVSTGVRSVDTLFTLTCSNTISSMSTTTTLLIRPNSCGPGSTSTPQLTEPTGSSACLSGALNSSSPANTVSDWNWSCGTITSCSAPKYGCNVTTDTNYVAGGPDNNWLCSNICANGSLTGYPACLPAVVIPLTPVVAPNTVGTVGFSLSPDIVDQGGSGILTWNSSFATRCDIVASSGSNPSTGGITAGSVSTGPRTADTTFNITCSNSVSSTSTQVMLTVRTDSCGSDSGAVPLLIGPSSINRCTYGSYITSPADTVAAWNWSCGTMTSCSAPKYGCNVPTNPNYSLPQYGASGPANDWGCAPITGVTATLSASSLTALYGDKVTLTWESTGATSCTAGGAWSNASKLAGSGLSDVITGDTTFTFQCTGPGGLSNLESVMVTLEALPVTAWLGSKGCVLPADGSGCDIISQWKVYHVTPDTLVDLKVTNKDGGVILHTGLPADPTIPTHVGLAGLYTIELLDHTTQVRIGTALTMSVCSPGYSINALGMCILTSGLIQAPSLCTIASGASTCTVSATWSAVDAISPELVDVNVNTVLWQPPAPSNGTLWVAYPYTTFKLRDGASVLDTAVVNGYCIDHSTWNGSKCLADVVIIDPVGPDTQLKATPSSVYVGGSSVLSWSSTGATSCSINNGVGGVAKTGSKSVTPAVTTSYTITCTNGVGPDATANVTVKVIEGSLSLFPTECTIYPEASTCTLNATWYTFNATTPKIYKGGTLLSSSPDSLSFNVQVDHGGSTFTLKDGLTLLSSKSALAECSVGSTWNVTDGKCSKPGGILSSSAISCDILVGNDSCPITLTWSTLTKIGVGISAVTNNRNPTIFSGDSGTDQPVAISGLFSDVSYYLYNVTQIAPTLTITPHCQAPLYWDTATSKCKACGNGGCNAHGVKANIDDPIPAAFTCNNGETKPLCAPAVVATLSLDKTSVSYNKTATLTWGSNGVAKNCTASTGPGRDSWSNSGSLNGSVSTGPLTTPKTYGFSCTGDGSPSSEVTASVVSVCPSDHPILITAGVTPTCAVLPVAGLVFKSGNYTANATIELFCDTSSSYVLSQDGIPFKSLAISPAVRHVEQINLTEAHGDKGKYTLTCNRSSLDGYLYSASAGPLDYQTSPVPPIVTLKQTPASIAKGSATVLSWSIMFPNSIQVPARPACTLTAAPVCVGGQCSSIQLSAAAAANLILNGTTDANDPGNGTNGTPRSIAGIAGALNTMPYHATNPDDWRALGKKTISLDKSMDFLLDCGSGPHASSTVRVNVTTSNEG